MSTSPGINRTIPTRVGSLAVADHGAGRPVVFWPSLFSDHRLYDLVVDRLGDGWRCIRIDGPGFGASDPPEGDVQPDVYADAVGDVLDAVGVDETFFAGCSWGGQVAAHFATRAPRRARGTLMMNTPLGPSEGGNAALVTGTRLIGSTKVWGRGVARAMMAPSTRSGSPARVRAFVSAFRSFDRTASATTARTVLTRSPGLASVLPLLDARTTILMGAEDRLYPPEAMQPFAAMAPAVGVEVVDGCGHLAPIEAPDAVVAALRTLADGDHTSGR